MIDEVKKLEAAARREIGGEVLHPDNCEKLIIKGVTFAVQPLNKKGVYFRPKVSGSKVDVLIESPVEEEDDALVIAAKQIVDTAPITESKVCDKCGQATGGELEIDFARDKEFLTLLVAYTTKLLRKQYELADEQIESLLSFSGETVPQWVTGVIRHAYGLGVNSVVLDEIPDEALEVLFAEPEYKRPWWKVW